MFDFLVWVGEGMEALDKTLTQAVKEGGYSNKFYAFLGEFYIRPTIGDERLARPGTLADDLKLSLMLANDQFMNGVVAAHLSRIAGPGGRDAIRWRCAAITPA